MFSEIVKGQLLALQLGRLKDRNELRHEAVSLAKRNNVWVARECAKLAREIHGANGIVNEYPIVRHLMNLETVYTYEGTHDIHTLVLGQYLTGIPAFEPRPGSRRIPPVGAGRSAHREPRSLIVGLPCILNAGVRDGE